ncbi:hypothetical protein SKAU_G00306170 [Synaphobranchus kaupii]|uniref:Uncharacterized protein n=1 Tax=Synaphobranchus kaupii TaxID=118154 RepID=A0A9Q1IKK5_SYNKA|nr:hypothetical protein SKAU_G00306170 [Synaphobranchus kaupii]
MQSPSFATASLVMSAPAPPSGRYRMKTESLQSCGAAWRNVWQTTYTCGTGLRWAYRPTDSSVAWSGIHGEEEGDCNRTHIGDSSQGHWHLTQTINGSQGVRGQSEVHSGRGYEEWLSQGATTPSCEQLKGRERVADKSQEQLMTARIMSSLFTLILIHSSTRAR